MKCLGDVVMVMEHKGRDASDGGIILPEGSKQRTYKGSVIAVGPGKPLPDGGRFPMTVRVDDVVAYPERTGDKVKIDGQELLAIPEQYVICVLVEAEDQEQELQDTIAGRRKSEMAKIGEALEKTSFDNGREEETDGH